MPQPAAVVFDLGKVLLDFDYGRVARKMLGHSHLSLDQIIQGLNQSPLLFRYETGLMTTAEFFEEVRRLSGFRQGLEEFEQMFGDIFSPIDPMIALNRELRARGVPTYIFSNTNEMAVRHIRSAYPFFAEFTDYIFSYEHRSMKPDAKLYEVVERRTGKRGGELLYIDDRRENIDHGLERGWLVIHHLDSAATIDQVQGMLFGQSAPN